MADKEMDQFLAMLQRSETRYIASEGISRDNYFKSISVENLEIDFDETKRIDVVFDFDLVTGELRAVRARRG